MHRSLPFPKIAPALGVSVLGAALLAACGGGGDAGLGLDDATAKIYAANATQIGSDTLTAADAGLLAAQAMIGAGAGTTASDGRATAMAADAMPLATSSRPCPGGGSATVTITGGTPQTQGNGKFDTGEVYQVTFAACSGAAGIAQLDGSYAITVESATGDSANGALSLATTATDLSVTLPRGTATFNGSTERQFTVSTDPNGTVHVTSHFISPNLGLVTHYNSRTSTFTLSNADVQRTATLVGGVLQSSTIVAVTVANGNATITIDRGKDGTIDRTIIVPVPELASDAG